MSGRRGNARGPHSRLPNGRININGNSAHGGGIAPHAARGRRSRAVGSGVPTTQRPVLFTRAAMMTVMRSVASAATAVATQHGRKRLTASELLNALGVDQNFSMPGPTVAGGLQVTHGFEAVLTMDTRNTPGGRQPGIRLLDISEGRSAPVDRHLINMDDVSGSGPIALQGHGGTFHMYPSQEMVDNNLQDHLIPTILVSRSVNELGVYEEDSDDSSSETDTPANRAFDIEE